VPEELTGRAEALGHALKAQGALAALALLAALEQRAKQALREVPTPRPALPPTQPSTPL
jgi:acetyl-CoA acetyltransferase